MNWTATIGFQGLAAVGWLAAVGAIALFLHRQPNLESEWVRKTVHIGTGNIILIAWWLHLPRSWGIIASIGAAAIALLSYVLPILPGINSVGRKSFGTLFYAISMGLLIAWFWPRQQPQFAALGILIMTWGDGLAGLIGKTWGRRLYFLWGMQKSWEGTATMAAVSFAIALTILELSVRGDRALLLLIALGVAIAAAGLEAFSKLGVDNLTVPLGCAAIAWGLVQGLGLVPISYF